MVEVLEEGACRCVPNLGAPPQRPGASHCADTSPATTSSSPAPHWPRAVRALDLYRVSYRPRDLSSRSACGTRTRRPSDHKNAPCSLLSYIFLVLVRRFTTSNGSNCCQNKARRKGPRCPARPRSIPDLVQGRGLPSNGGSARPDEGHDQGRDSQGTRSFFLPDVPSS